MRACNRPALTVGPPIHKSHMLEGPHTGLFPISGSSRAEEVRSQNSTVKSLVPKLPIELPKLIWLLVPLKSNACPTSPWVKESAVGVPLLLPVTSRASPSPFHHPTRLDGTGTQDCGGGDTGTTDT